MTQYITAIEIGSSKVKGAVGLVKDDGSLNVLAIEELPIGNSVRYGVVINVEDVRNKINHIVKLLNNNSHLSSRRITSAYVALGGRSLASHPAETTLKLNGETEITDALLADLKRRVQSNNPTSKELLAVVPTSFSVDGRAINNPVGTFGSEIRGRYNLIILNEQNKKNIQRTFDKTGLKIKGYLLKSLSLASAVLTKDDRQLGCVLVDFGAETTTVSIYKNEALVYTYTLPIGSRFITRDLATLLNVTEEKAENIKKFQANVGSNTDDLGDNQDELDTSQIDNIVQARLSEIIANIKNQIACAKLKPEDLPNGIIMAGNGTLLNGFLDKIKKDTLMKVRYATSVKTFSSSPNVAEHTSDSLDVISLMLTAARDTQNAECTEEIQKEQQVVIETVDNDDDKKKADAKKKPKGGGLFGRMGDFLGKMMSDDFDEDDEDDKEENN